MSKIFKCPIHGHIELEQVEVKFIDTRQFQRLRELKQLGVTHFVFPGATHSRFEHSLGVCHLAGMWLDIINKNQPELKITASDRKCARLAGLAHDLGHGPFSHLFDGRFINSVIPGSVWCHEDASQDMLDLIMAENPDIDINENELELIKDLIKGEPSPNHKYPRTKRFIFDLVSNSRNSVDVDKFDYILRDCYFLGFKADLDPVRLMTFSRVIDDQICFNQKEAFNLSELFRTRFRLFKQVYTHRVSSGIEFMVRDVLIAADPVLRISCDIKNMKNYTLLDDRILYLIERSTDIRLNESKRLLNRLRCRDLYRFADQTILPPTLFGIDKSLITAEKIAKETNQADQISQADIIVQFLTLNFALKDKNPLDSMFFFTKHDSTKRISIPKAQISGLMPAICEEKSVRVYSRKGNMVGEIQTAFRKLLKKINNEFESKLLLAESEENTSTAFKLAKVEENPFLVSPSNNLSMSPSIFSTPKKEKLEIHVAHSIPAKRYASTPSLNEVKRVKTTI